MAKSSITPVESVTERAANSVKNVSTIVTVFAGITGVVFGAGVLYATISATLSDYLKRFEAMEQSVKTQEANIAAIQQSLTSIRDGIDSALGGISNRTIAVGDVVQSTEPLHSGGGNYIECPPGSFVIGLQTFKDDNGQRTLRAQCGKLEAPSLP